MLIAALGFSLMSGFAKVLKTSFNTPQLVFYRNLIGLFVLTFSFLKYPLKSSGGRFYLLIFRGLMGTIALYTLMYNILHISLSTAMTYNTTNTLFIALLSFLVLKERLNFITWICIILGFGGVLLIYKPTMDFEWKYHLIGLCCGLSSAIAYLSVSSLNKYYDTRLIVLSFVLVGTFVPAIAMTIGTFTTIPDDGFFITSFMWPKGDEWLFVTGMGLTALMGQYFVTKAFANDKAGIVSAIGYSIIIFSMLIGWLLGDPLPDLLSWFGTTLVIVCGIVISLAKK